jgi:hypothetical protein
MWAWSAHCAERASAAARQSRWPVEPRPTILDPRPWEGERDPEAERGLASDYSLIG